MNFQYWNGSKYRIKKNKIDGLSLFINELIERVKEQRDIYPKFIDDCTDFLFYAYRPEKDVIKSIEFVNKLYFKRYLIIILESFYFKWEDRESKMFQTLFTYLCW